MASPTSSSSMMVPPEPPTPTEVSLVSPRGARLATRTWPVTTTTNPKAILLMIHGGGWHSGYFSQLAQRLQQDSIYCASYDQCGHGYSDPEPGAPDGLLHVHEFGDLVEDVFAAVDWVRKEVGVAAHHHASNGLPLFLFGESFGGLQVLAAGLDTEDPRQSQIAGVIVSGALLEIGEGLLPPKPLIRVLSWLAPYYPKFPMPASDMESTFDEAFGDKQWAAVARKDSKVIVSPKPTLMAAVCTLTTGATVMSRADDWRKLDLPLLAVHSKQDCRAQWRPVQQFVDQAGPMAEGYWLDDTTGHQLLQDQPHVTERVMSKIASWIQARLADNKS